MAYAIIIDSFTSVVLNQDVSNLHVPCWFSLLVLSHSLSFSSHPYFLPSSAKHFANIMLTSSNGHIFRVTNLCAGSSPVTGEFHIQRPVTRSFDVFSDLRLNQKLSKQWRRNRAHYDITVIIPVIGITIQQLCNKVSSSLYFFVIDIHDFSLCYLF